ncbi:MAG: hypothetical protein HYY83_05790, partial [Deltaproteobacteria bacterium]|nr:hypothetical protein [Deltaproteobacteria bacterium]
MITSITARALVREAATEPRVVHSVLDLVGNTPLLQIGRITHGLSPAVRIF